MENGGKSPRFFTMLSGLAVAYIHGNFKAKAHFNSFWFGPHNISPHFAHIGQVQFQKWKDQPIGLKDSA